jgi:lipopolysaccharide transport system permease protein
MLSYLRKIRKYRQLIVTLARRDIKAKYAQTVLGIVWTLIQPLTGLLIFTLFFHHFLGIESGLIPYPLFVFSGLIAWYFFSSIIYQAGTSLLSSRELIEKIYFPKLIILMSKVGVAYVEILMSFIVFFIILLFWPIPLSWRIFTLPVWILLISICGLAIAIWLAALTVRNRDLQHIIPYVINYGIWLTPVFYPTLIIPETYHDFVYFFNPLATLLEWLRWSIFYGPAPPTKYLLSLVWVVVLFVLGLLYFIKIDKKIIDYA